MHTQVAAAHTLFIGYGVAVLACPAGGWGVHSSTATVPTTLSRVDTRGRALTQHDPDTDPKRTHLGHGPQEGRITPCTLIATARVPCVTVITPSKVQNKEFTFRLVGGSIEEKGARYAN